MIGDRARCEQAAALLRDVAAPERRMLGPIGLAYLALNEGRLDDADAIYRQVVSVLPIGRGFIRWETEWIETLTRAGRRDEAEALFHELVAEVPPDLLSHAGADADPGPAGRRRRRRGRALRHLGGRGRGDASTRTPRRGSCWCGESGCAGLATASRPGPTSPGRRSCSATVGATVLADRAATELRAAGGTIADDVASHRLLTPHELQVARLVVGGASNRDLAAKLFISPRTVESHLTSIFRKLGVRNRQELAARAIDDPILQP